MSLFDHRIISFINSALASTHFLRYAVSRWQYDVLCNSICMSIVIHPSMNGYKFGWIGLVNVGRGGLSVLSSS